MDRQPIVSNTEGHDISLVQLPLTIDELVPKYQYKLSDSVPDESTGMYLTLVDFLKENPELATSAEFSTREDYVHGFSNALAIVRLWIDSLYVQGDISTQ